MKSKIRHNVFETNSSSTHAICIGKEHIDDLNELIRFVKFWNLDSGNNTYKLKFNSHEYGWKFDILGTHPEKADYLYTSMLDLYSYGSDKFNDGCKFIMDTLKKYDIECVFEYPIGYEYKIDHFEGMDTEWIKKCLSDSAYLLRYLFDNSVVITGNDNNVEFGNLMNLIDVNKCDIYYKGN